MRLASLAEVVRGRLLNSPSVTEVDRFVFDAAKVRRGDCYLHLNGDEPALQTALKAGAYAVLFTGECAITDEEIGWIHLKSVDRALLGLLRFLIVEKEAVVYAADSVSLALARSYIRDPQLWVASDARSAIERLQQSGPPPALLFDASSVLIEAAVSTLSLPAEPLKAIKEGIWETALESDNGPLKLAVASLFMPQLSGVVALAKNRALNLNLHHNPVLIGRFEPAPLGDRVLIFDRATPEEQNEALAFLKRIAPWAKVFTPNPQPLGDLAAMLNKTPFQYAYLVGFDKPAVLEAIEAARPKTPSLF